MTTATAPTPVLMQRMAYVRKLAQECFERYNIEGWSVNFAIKDGRAGECNYATQHIGFSTHYIEKASIEQVRNTVLHEIAHVLTGRLPKPHSSRWKTVFKAIGGNGQAYTTPPAAAVASGDYRWVGKCPTCSHEIGERRAPTAVFACSRCCADGKFNREHIFHWFRDGVEIAPEAVGKAYARKYAA